MPTAARRSTATPDTAKTDTPATSTTDQPAGPATTSTATKPPRSDETTGAAKPARTAAGTTDTAATDTTAGQPSDAAATGDAGQAPSGEQAAEQAQQLARAAAEKAAALRSGVIHTARTVVTLPVTATVAVVDDVVSAVRRPDVVLYGGALAGLAALGVLAWPVAGAVGVGVAVASGVRRART
jgi:hypothetical protein